MPSGKVIKHASNGGKQINVEYGHGQEEEINELDDDKLREEEENEKGENSDGEFCENCDCEKPSQKTAGDSHGHGCGSDDCCQATPKSDTNNTSTRTNVGKSSVMVGASETKGDITSKNGETSQVSRPNNASATSYITTTVKFSALALVLAIFVMFYLA